MGGGICILFDSNREKVQPNGILMECNVVLSLMPLYVLSFRRLVFSHRKAKTWFSFFKTKYLYNSHLIKEMLLQIQRTSGLRITPQRLFTFEVFR
jgi:hypothetical protein